MTKFSVFLVFFFYINKAVCRLLLLYWPLWNVTYPDLIGGFDVISWKLPEAENLRFKWYPLEMFAQRKQCLRGKFSLNWDLHVLGHETFTICVVKILQLIMNMNLQCTYIFWIKFSIECIPEYSIGRKQKSSSPKLLNMEHMMWIHDDIKISFLYLFICFLVKHHRFTFIYMK